MNRFQGLLVIFHRPEDLLSATKLVHEKGFRRFDPVSPYAIEELFPYLGLERDVPAKFRRRFPGFNTLGACAFVAGLTGMSTGFGLQWFAHAWAEAMDAGGRPFFSWPIFIPITFVLSILFAGLTVFFGLILLVDLPRPYHAYFNAPSFNLSEERFYLYVSAADPLFDRAALESLMAGIPSAHIEEVLP